MDSVSESRLVLGTAGHIDHGKTALIRALTGTDTDRLPEEKARGITIELGFAALDLPDGTRLSVVDVPGHERLVRTMVSGASGIDLVMLVVAADEGAMPQTREHVAICRLLGIDRGLVALTKVDLVDAEMRELASADVEALLEAGPLAGAPVIPVSSSSGEGLDALREALAKLARTTPARTPRASVPRLPVDRAFAMKGFGTVVTGTLVGGALETGQAVELWPRGLRARVRGLQSHGQSVGEAEPGARCAVNLQGIEVAQVSRGDVVAPPESLAPTRVADLSLHWLAEAKPAEESSAVEFLSGTAERRAHISPIGATRFEPGVSGYARVHLEGDPVPLLPGDRFVVRGFARNQETGATLGGGVVLDVSPPRRRRSDPELRRELAILETADPVAMIVERIRRTGLAGASQEALRRESGLLDLDDLLAAQQAAGELLQVGGAGSPRGGELWLSKDAAMRIEARMLEALDRFHAGEPLRPGAPSGALRSGLPDNVPTAVAERALERLARAGRIARDGDLVRRSDFAPQIDAATQSLLERLLAESRAAGLEAPGLREWSERHALPEERLRDLLAHLERAGELVRAPGDLWFPRAAVETLRAQVVEHLKQHGELDTPAYKKLIGTTRRSAVPVMELFDEQHVTHRRGNLRVLRSGAAE